MKEVQIKSKAILSVALKCSYLCNDWLSDIVYWTLLTQTEPLKHLWVMDILLWDTLKCQPRDRRCLPRLKKGFARLCFVIFFPVPMCIGTYLLLAVLTIGIYSTWCSICIATGDYCCFQRINGDATWPNLHKEFHITWGDVKCRLRNETLLWILSCENKCYLQFISKL